MLFNKFRARRGLYFRTPGLVPAVYVCTRWALSGGGLHTKPPPAPRVFSKKRLSRCRHTSPPKRPYGAQLQPSQASTTSSCPSSIRTPTRCRSPSPSTARGTRIQPRGHVARGYNHVATWHADTTEFYQRTYCRQLSHSRHPVGIRMAKPTTTRLAWHSGNHTARAHCGEQAS